MVRTDTRRFEPSTAELTTARVYIEEPGAAPRVIELRPGTNARVGRADDVEIPVNDRRASRRHAVLRYDGERVTIEDLASSNGTFLGIERLGCGPVTVAPGSLIRVGSTRLVLSPQLSSESPAQAHPRWGDPAVVAVDPATVALFRQAQKLSAGDLNVLVTGETGVGKELVARAIHRYSARSAEPLTVVRCASLTEGSAAHERFDFERDENHGVWLLDGVEALSPANQFRLVRALDERTHPPKSRGPGVLSVTSRDLSGCIRDGSFREDLYFRLAGATLRVPSLRDRRDDIAPLATRFMAECTAEMGPDASPMAFGPGVVDAITAYGWPGNVRELRQMIASSLALCTEGFLCLEHLPDLSENETQPPAAATLRGRVDDAERREIIQALNAQKNNQSRAARALGISRRALIYKMERYGLKAPPGSSRRG